MRHDAVADPSSSNPEDFFLYSRLHAPRYLRDSMFTPRRYSPTWSVQILDSETEKDNALRGIYKCLWRQRDHMLSFFQGWERLTRVGGKSAAPIGWQPSAAAAQASAYDGFLYR
jgi:hypothetical protein